MSKYVWFLETKNQLARDALAAELEGRYEENLSREIADNLGKHHNLVRVDFYLVDFVLKSQELRNLFRIFNRRGENGQLRDVTKIVKRFK